MRPSTLLASGLAGVLALSPLASEAGTTDHFILTRLSTLGHFRYDPIVSPGKVSGHVHNIIGGSCFNNVLNTPEEQQACDCSTAIIGDDRSNYWSPTLYYQFKNGSLSPMLGSNRIYYFLKSEDVKPFPPGLRMISGSPAHRNMSDYKSLGVRISCDTAEYGEGAQGAFLPNKTSHPNGCSGIVMGVYYPSCGLADGSLDSEDHFSHMAWPIKHLGGGAAPVIDVNGWECPDTHPIKYPTIFHQSTYYPTSSEMPWDTPNPVVLSNGDQSGNTFHADFFNGWKADTLKATIAQCGIGKGPGEHLEECAPLAKTMSEEKTWLCRYQNEIPNEDVGLYRPIKKLPGCNPIWPTNGPATKPTCKESNVPGTVHPNTEFENLSYRMHLPLLFTLANDTDNKTEMAKFIPGLGVTGSSKVRTYGVGASNEDSLIVSTVEEILAVPGQPMQGVVVSGSSSGTVGRTSSTAVASSAATSKSTSSTSKATSSATKATSSATKAKSSTSKAASSAIKASSSTSKVASSTSKATSSTSKASSSKASSSKASSSKASSSKASSAKASSSKASSSKASSAKASSAKASSSKASSAKASSSKASSSKASSSKASSSASRASSSATKASATKSSSTSTKAAVTTSAVANAGVLLPTGGGTGMTASIESSRTSLASYESAASHGPTHSGPEATSVDGTTAGEHAGAPAPAKGNSKVCKPKKRPPPATCDNRSFKVREHLHRRSRHGRHEH